MMVITYWDNNFKQSNMILTDAQVNFTDDGITFFDKGHRYRIPYGDVYSIEPALGRLKV